VLPTELNPYGRRYRVEEACSLKSRAARHACHRSRAANVWRATSCKAASSAPARAASSFDVVISSTAAYYYTFEPDAFVFDPYLVTTTGPLPKYCKVAPQSADDEDRLKDMSQMTRHGTNLAQLHQ
jgi:hypothetical protein